MPPPMVVAEAASEDDDALSYVEEEEEGGEDKPSERSELADRVAAELVINSSTRPLAAANRAPAQTPATGRRQFFSIYNSINRQIVFRWLFDTVRDNVSQN